MSSPRKSMNSERDSQASLAFIRLMAVIATGLYAGIILGDRLGATYGRAVISTLSFVQFQQMQHVHFKAVLPALILIAALASAAWVLLLRARPRSSEFRLALGGAIALLIAVALTLAVNAPINHALMTWNPGFPPYNARVIWLQWERAHTWRAAASVVGFVLQVMALNAAARHA